MYCMPQAGTRVALYFPNVDEKQAKVTSCVRTNGGSCARMGDPSRRAFVTEHGKELTLYPGEMSLIGGSNGVFSMVDEAGITMTTSKKILMAGQSVTFKGKNVGVAAPTSEIVIEKTDMERGNVESSTVQSNALDMKSFSKTAMKGTKRTRNKPYKDAPGVALLEKEEPFDWGGLLLNVAIGIVAVVAVVAICAFSFGFGFGVALAACAVGAAFVANKAVNDYVEGSVSPWYEYALTGACGGLVGSIFAAGIVGTYGMAGAARLAGKALTPWYRVASVMGLGATVAGVADFGWQRLVEGKSSSDIDYFSVLSSALGGAAAASGMGLGLQIIFNGTKALAESMSNNRSIGDSVASAVISGGITAFFGPGILSVIDQVPSEILSSMFSSVFNGTIAGKSGGIVLSEIWKQVTEGLGEIRDSTEKQTPITP